MSPKQQHPFTLVWLPLATFTGWVALMLVGLLGLALPYARPQPSPPPSEPPPVEMLDIQLANAPEPAADTPPPPPDYDEPPPLLDPIEPLKLAAPVAVAEMTDAVAFAMPVEGPVRVVKMEQASYSPPVRNAVAAPAPPPPPVTRIVFGRGEGRQPAPRYPREAVRQGQEGSVLVMFIVGRDGRVISAELSSSCPWPLLNHAALQVVRKRWRFARGPIRRYEAPIRFELTD